MDNRFWNNNLFKGITEESRMAVSRIKTRECIYPANHLIIKKGEEIKYICVILEGVLKFTDYTLDGKEINSSYFYLTDDANFPFAGEAFPFYLIYGGIKNYNYNTYSLKKSKVVWIPIKDLLPIIENDNKFLINVLKFVAEYACYSKMLLKAVQYFKVEERLAFWMIYMNNPDKEIQIPYSQEILADILHTSRTSLNQELKKLQIENLISMEDRTIKVLNKDYFINIL